MGSSPKITAEQHQVEAGQRAGVVRVGRGDDLIRHSIQAHLERTSFNNVGDVKKAIERMGLAPGLVTPYQRDLASLMARRHNIVHRADRLERQGSGYHGAASLGQGLVDRWIASVEGLCTDIVAAL